MTAALVIIIILVLLVLVVAGAGIGLYNGLVRLRNLVQESWRQVDVELNRRYELIPNLVETVRASAAHERNTLEQVTQLRNQAASLAQGQGHDTPSPQRAQAEEQLSGAVRNLLVSVEAYPQLQSNGNFLELQKQLAETEDRIAAGRRYYNANVREYNTKQESFPGNLVAGPLGFQRATYFEVTDPSVRQTPSVNFGEIADRGGQQPQIGSQQQGQQWPQQQTDPQHQPQQQQWPEQPR
ncbi:LemA family protein [Naumannella halotolerans]|uniref:LemA protein n=1 Tax=Naumannella halotolerans TaxID=993414 RepID=A0A4R7JAE6_9ACTN|nr:LemA family protein [Naumannella halotolerans]TDT34530.1 LemA protein [Naumannella halotolerans]